MNAIKSVNTLENDENSATLCKLETYQITADNLMVNNIQYIIYKCQKTDDRNKSNDEINNSI